MRLDQIWQQLHGATEWQSALSPLPTLSAQGLKQRYRELALLVHPDNHPGQADLAAEAFHLLQRWYQIGQGALITPETGKAARGQPFCLTTRTGHYQSSGQPLVGDLCDLYPAAPTDHITQVWLKVVRQPRNNDLLRAEGKALTHLGRELAHTPARAHFPTLIDQVQLREPSGETRLINLLERETGYLTLTQVLRSYPAGVAPADAAWIYKRLLAALAITHDLGLVHGAVTLDHLLIRPHDHNGLLVDWCYSVPLGEVIKAVSPLYRADYPPEVLGKRSATPATDLYMAAKVMVRLLGGDPATNALPATVPKAIGAFLQSCLIAAPHRRPDSAWELFTEFDAILQRCYGPPKFRPFPPVAPEE